jgi:hypothetical protein
MTRFTSLVLAGAVLLVWAATSRAATPLGNPFDGRMSVIYDDNSGGVYIENAPHPNPHVSRLQISSASGLLDPSGLLLPALAPPQTVTLTANLFEINWTPPIPFLGTGSFFGTILPPFQAAGLLQADLTIRYSTSFAAPTIEGDLIHTAIVGSTQGNPVLPAPTPNGFFRFFDVATGQFCDPPMASGYVYSMDTPGALFTEVGMPMGLGNDFSIVSSEGVVTDVDEGELHTFSGGVPSFKILGINPPVDATDAEAFPVFLQFTSPNLVNDIPTASFTMVPIPEPSTLAMLAIAVGGAIIRGRRRR